MRLLKPVIRDQSPQAAVELTSAQLRYRRYWLPPIGSEILRKHSRNIRLCRAHMHGSHRPEAQPRSASRAPLGLLRG
uniref:Uncharacterized protein n=1 Tax=Yersinia enterocolitica TaxID=630 RepID=B0RL55_YEREN|nr:hypothetical protein [Yersinia enterocolitica]